MRLACQLKTYGIEHTPVKPEKCIPMGIVQSIVAAGDSTSDPKTRHIAGLVKLGFYFCLRSCEYTKCTDHRRIVHFRPFMDFILFVGD